MRRILFIFIALISFSKLFATGEPSTYFNIYVPPNNDAVHRYVALIVTAIHDSTYFEIIDDDMDGDSDDSYSGYLMANQSYILYIKDNGINDDAAWSAGGIQKPDGDYFIIKSNKLVYASQSTDSDWQYDWVPATNKSSRGKKFVVYAPNTSFSNRDLNVFAYEDQTTVTIKKISTVAKTSTGTTTVDNQNGTVVSQLTLDVGQELIYYYNDGRNILESGHTYLVEANKDVTVQYGALFTNARDGGGYVPSANGSSSGEMFYFTVPYDRDLEQEIRMISWDDANSIFLERFENNNWIPVKNWNLESMKTGDWIGRAEGGSFPTSFRASCTPGKKISIFTANWLETGNPGTSDISTMESSKDGTSSGKEFLCYVAPPGSENNCINPFTGQVFGGQYSHLFIFARDTAHIIVKDAFSNGADFYRTYTIEPGRYIDCELNLQEWRSIYNGDGNPSSGHERPYLHVISDANVSVMNTNFNDNWMMYFGSSLEQSFKQSSETSKNSGIPGDTVQIVNKVILDTQDTVKQVSGEVNISSGAVPTKSTFIDSSNMQTVEGNIEVNETGSIVTFDSLPDLDTNGNYSIVTDVVLSASENDGSTLEDNSVVTVETTVSGTIDGTLQQSNTSEGISVNSSNTSNLIFSKFENSPLVSTNTDSWNASWVDFDNDRDQDIFVTTQDLNQPNYLYENLGNGNFSAITQGKLVSRKTQSMSSAWADIDNDGDQDVLIINNNYHPIQLYENEGNGNFKLKGNAGFPVHPAYYHGASWIDVNLDGFLDVIISNYMPTRFHELYINQGNGTFAHEQNSVLSQESGYNVAPTWIDYDNDGLTDLFLTNNLGQNNTLFKNMGGSFQKVQNEITQDGGFSVAACWGDVDRDGDMDLFVANSSGQKDFFYFNNGDGTFQRDSTLAFADQGTNMHGCSWIDVDNDMDLDLYLTDDQGAKKLYIQNSGFSFTNKMDELAVGHYGKTYGQAIADFNQDGHLDMFVSTHSNEPNFLWKNNGNDKHFINIRFTGTASNRNAIGTKVKLKAGGVWQTAWVNAQNGYGSQNSLDQHFGLGSNTVVDSLIISWPSTYVQVETNIQADQFIEITEVESIVVKGTVYADLNSNCNLDNNEINIGNQKLTISPINLLVVTDESGNYEFRVPAGNYSINYSPSGNWNTNCPALNIQLSPTTVELLNQNIGISSATYVPDLTASYGTNLWRRGFKSESFVRLENKGTATAYNCNVQLQYPTQVDFHASTKNSTRLSNRLYSFTIDSLKAGATEVIYLEDSVNLNAQVGESYVLSVNVAAANGETELSNNQITHTEEVVGAVDPNDLLAWPRPFKGEEFAQLFPEDTITYRIRFQNVGTYEAANIYVESKIPFGTDATSLVMKNTSHSCSYTVKGDKIEWVFRNINLPDSTTDEAGSHGFIDFTLSVLKNAQEGQLIENSAEITFDYEDALVTNTVSHRVIISSPDKGKLKVWPNPATSDDQLWMLAAADNENVAPRIKYYTISSLSGMLIDRVDVNQRRVKLDNSKLKQGSYIIKAVDENENVHKAVLVKL